MRLEDFLAAAVELWFLSRVQNSPAGKFGFRQLGSLVMEADFVGFLAAGPFGFNLMPTNPTSVSTAAEIKIVSRSFMQLNEGLCMRTEFAGATMSLFKPVLLHHRGNPVFELRDSPPGGNWLRPILSFHVQVRHSREQDLRFHRFRQAVLKSACECFLPVFFVGIRG